MYTVETGLRYLGASVMRERERACFSIMIIVMERRKELMR